jgi:hypothetical protein
LAKHSKHFSLEDSLAIGVDRMQRNFGPLKQQVEEWQAMQLSTAAAKPLIYQWSLSNAFTSAFKELEPIPQYKATAWLAEFLQAVRPS